MAFQFQIKVKNADDIMEWRSVRPSGSQQPYEYDTKAEAWRMLEMCYPDIAREDGRVIEVYNQREEGLR